MMLHGREKLGKTQYTFKLMHSVVTGNEIATLPVISPGEVLYYNEDGILPDTADLFSKRVEEYYFEEPWDIDMMTNLADALKKCDEDDDYRAEFIKRLSKYKMIVIDPIAGIFDDYSMSSNTAEDASALIRHKIRPIQAECDNLWLLIHHNNKGSTDQKGNKHSTFAGSVQIRASVDLSLEIVGEGDDVHIILAHSRYDDTIFPITITENGWELTHREEGEVYGPLKGMYSGRLVANTVLLEFDNAKIKCRQLHQLSLSVNEYKLLAKLRSKNKTHKLGIKSLRTWLQHELGLVFGGTKKIDDKLKVKLATQWGALTKSLTDKEFIEIEAQSFKITKKGLEVIEGELNE